MGRTDSLGKINMIICIYVTAAIEHHRSTVKWIQWTAPPMVQYNSKGTPTFAGEGWGMELVHVKIYMDDA